MPTSWDSEGARRWEGEAPGRLEAFSWETKVSRTGQLPSQAKDTFHLGHGADLLWSSGSGTPDLRPQGSGER